MRSDRGQKRKHAQKSTKGKSAGGKFGKEPSLKLKDVSTGRSEKKNKKIEKTKGGCFRSRDDVHAIFIRSLLYSRYGKGKTRQELYLYHTEKDIYLAKENTNYVRYKRPVAKKLI